MKIRVEVAIEPEEILKRRGLESGGQAQQWLENEVINQCIPYTSFDEGILAYSGTPWPYPGGGFVKWPGPYAHYQYMGIVYGPNFQVEQGGEMVWRSLKDQKKQPTGRTLDYGNSQSKHDPRAGSHWVERMMADKSGEILDGLAKLTGGKPKK